MNNFCSRWPDFLSLSGVQDGLFIVITPRYFFVDFWPRERKRNKLRRTEKLTKVLIHCCNLLNITWMDNVLCLCVLRGCLEFSPPPQILKRSRSHWGGGWTHERSQETGSLRASTSESLSHWERKCTALTGPPVSGCLLSWLQTDSYILKFRLYFKVTLNHGFGPR